MPKIILFFLFVLSSLPLFAQQKYEREIRLDPVAVPESARTYIDAFDFDGKVKWYKEIGLDTFSIEAKTKHDGTRYSIEFNPEGKLEDVEIQTEMSDIIADTRCNIVEHFRATYERFHIDKVQVQYTGAPQAILDYLQKKGAHPDVIVNYEIVMNAKPEKSYKRYEFLFSESGVFLQKKEIVLKNLNNIQY